VRSRRNKISVDEAESAYRLSKRAFRVAIKRAKNKSWGELISTINKDPWGLPYKIVMGKLRRSSPTMSETLERGNLDRLVMSLFPNNVSAIRAPMIPPFEWDEELDVSFVEIDSS